MNNQFEIENDQITFYKQVIYHFYPGVFFTIFYIFSSQFFVDQGYPGLTALLVAAVVILAPITLGHLFYKSYKINDRFTLKNVIFYTERLSWKQYLLWTLFGIFLCTVVYIPMYPVGLYLRDSVFSWLPEWYFNPAYGTSDLGLLANIFLLAVLVDGLIIPIVEELYFRGYLLPRMSYLGNWAPVINGAFFGLYHFWQPHNLMAIVAVGIALSYVVWKTKNVYIGIIVHCTLNLLGDLGAYTAVLDGVIIER